MGYMPSNPRSAVNACPSLVAAQGLTLTSNPNPTPALQPYMTGGSGANTILNSTMLSQFSAWPPASLGTTPVSNLPTYAPTGSIITMPAPASPTSFPSGYSASVNVGDGWVQSTDTAGWFTEVAGCSYLNPWSGAGAAGEYSRDANNCLGAERTGD